MKLLIIAPAFPPDKSVGVVRISSFVSYLKEQGHFITVLTQRKDNYEVGLCDEYVTVDQDKNYNCGIISRYKQFVANGNKYQEKCIEILNKYKFDLVLITGGPFFTFKLSRQIYLRKTPCALDFRDPWVGDVRGMKDLLSPKRIISRMLFFPMEIKAIHYADLVTTVTPGWVKMLKQMHPFEKDKIELVKNGYDEKKMPRLYDTKKYNTLDIQIGVFGKLFYYSTYYSKVFLNAIHEMSSDKKISLFQIGDKEENADGLLRECGLESEVLASTGFVDYGQGIYMLSKVDILLIIDSRKSALGTKLYDYIYIAPLYNFFIKKYRTGLSDV